MNEFLILVCFHAQFLLNPLNCPYLSLPHSGSFPHCIVREVSKQLRGAELPTGVKLKWSFLEPKVSLEGFVIRTDFSVID